MSKLGEKVTKIWLVVVFDKSDDNYFPKEINELFSSRQVTRKKKRKKKKSIFHNFANNSTNLLAVSSEAQPAKKDSKKKTDSNNIKKKKTRWARINGWPFPIFHRVEFSLFTCSMFFFSFASEQPLRLSNWRNWKGLSNGRLTRTCSRGTSSRWGSPCRRRACRCGFRIVVRSGGRRSRHGKPLVTWQRDQLALVCRVCLYYERDFT